jgi:hypothetical protein
VPDISYYYERIPADAPPEVQARMMEEAKRKAEEDVFGVGFQRDRNGKPIERGIGAPGNETEHHFTALEKAEGREVADRAKARAKAAKEKAAPR